MTPAPRARGFTLIELLVVIALIGIMGLLAAPSFQRVASRSALSGTATGFATAVMQARSEAIRTSRRVYLQPGTGTNWMTGWTIWIDNNGDGTFNSANDPVVLGATPVDSRLAMDTVTSTSISFDPTGFPTSLASSCVSFQLASNAWGEKSRQVVIAATGRVRIVQATSGASCPST